MDRGSDGEMKSVSTNMAQGQMQLAMEETVARKDRDVRAIRWLIDNLTEDAEMEKFLSAIPGSFNTDWGTEVWRRVGKHHENEDQSQNGLVARPHRNMTIHQPSSSWSISSALRQIIRLVRNPAPHHRPTHATAITACPPVPHVHLHSATAHIRGGNVIHELSTRVARSVEICKNRKLFSSNDLWRKRTRACIEATASLVCCTNAKLAWFGDVPKLLGDIGGFEKIRELSLSGIDQLFVIRWTCLSLVAIRQVLEDSQGVQIRATRAKDRFADTGNNDAPAGAQRINEALQRARGCLFGIYHKLRVTEDLTEEVIEILRHHESQSQISELEQIDLEANSLTWVDFGIFRMQNAINLHSHQITSQFPGALDDLDWAHVPFSRLVELFQDPRKMQFIRPVQTLKGMCSPATTLRNILEGNGDAEAYRELLKNLEKFPFWFGWQEDEMQRQLWRLEDLSDGGGLGFMVELFFLAFSQLLSTSSSKESHSALYTGTFLAITSDRSNRNPPLGTQSLLLIIAWTRREEFVKGYPAYIVDEFLILLGNILEGQEGPHIDKARQRFESFRLYDSRGFRERVLRVLTRG